MELISELREELKMNPKSLLATTKICSKLEAKFVDLERNLDEVLKENQILNEKLTEIKVKSKNGIIRDIQKSYNEEQNSDFTIKIGEKVFKVHKFMLAARSSVLSEMIQSNNEATQLDLLDISEATFKMILDFIYCEKFPEDNSNFMEIFMASGRLNLKDLNN